MSGTESSAWELSDLQKFTGQDTGYSYRALRAWVSRTELNSYITRTRQLSSLNAKQYSDTLNSQWIVRNHLCAKYMMASTVLFGSARHCINIDILIVLPYLYYYSILNCCRAFLFTVPDLEWKGLNSIEMTHQNIINTCANYLRRLSPEFAKEWKSVMIRARSERELFSYRFPALGPKLLEKGISDEDDVLSLCQILADLSQLNSECLMAALDKHYSQPFEIDKDFDWSLAISYEIVEGEPPVIDDDDYYRISRHLHRGQRPRVINDTLTEGMEEDFLGAWRSESVENGFNVDECMGLVFDMY